MTRQRVEPRNIADHKSGPAIVLRVSLVRRGRTTIDLAEWRADCPAHPTIPDAHSAHYGYGRKRGAPDQITNHTALDRELPVSDCSAYPPFHSYNDTLRWYLRPNTCELIAGSDRDFGADMQAFICMRDRCVHYDACLSPAWVPAVRIEALAAEALFPVLHYDEEEWHAGDCTTEAASPGPDSGAALASAWNSSFTRKANSATTSTAPQPILSRLLGGVSLSPPQSGLGCSWLADQSYDATADINDGVVPMLSDGMLKP
ncbi:hypothetical protein FN846DRAFT_914705 [Sphaerosporella brunnea]|uniref:Uncharacterized protein n=1 Tax=Sphaerosporella brunnea TaxID=1250544 RepID=A0A5J5ECU0_9PEZI|nr:hypothetical protein FN846DRAFT_914705 [Sphaerosporella brunnea]